MGVIADRIRKKLAASLQPIRLEVRDDSALHAGHSGAREGGESHFTLIVESPGFVGQTRLSRQRQIHALLAEELAGPVHALSIKALAPGES